MGTAHYLVDENRMIELVSGEEFYEEKDAFLRELLQNACDACYTKKELGTSWGAEFLALEKDKLEQFAKVLYEPQIKITYDSTTRTFLIMDNGIGIDATDFDQFVRRMGSSFYTSERYLEQHLSYTPVGRFGIGLLSCFGVTKSIRIESKKDRAINTAWSKNHFSKLVPVHAEWDKNRNEIEISPGKKQQAGTVIGFILEPDMARSMNLQYLAERIEYYTAFQRIPIELEVDGEKMCLHRRMMKKEENLLNVKGIHVLDVEDNLIEGYLVIYQEQHEEMVEPSCLYQQGFYITSDDSRIGMKPEWLRNMSYHINLKSNYLSLRSNRSSVVYDEKLMQIRKKIGEKILAYFSMNPFGLSPFLKSGRSDMLSPFKSEMECIGNLVRIDACRDGKKVSIPVNTAVEGLAGRKVSIAIMSESMHDYFREKYRVPYQEMVDKYDLFFFENHIHVFLQCVDAYTEQRNYIASKLSGIVYLDVKLSIPSQWKITKGETSYYWNKQLVMINSYLCFTCNDHNGLLELVMNPYHPFIKKLHATNITPSMRLAWAVIMENIKQRILNKGNRCGKLLEFHGSMVDYWSDERTITLESVGCLEKKFPNLMNEYIRKKVPSDELIKMGLEKVEFTKEDFIPWWFQGYWDGF